MTGLILYGDSVFFGYGASNKNMGCGRQLKTLLSVPVIIKARNNITTQDALTGLQNNALSGYNKYSDVIILFGNNDCRLIGIDTPKISLKEYKNNLIEIINLITSCGKKCYISNLQPINDAQVIRVDEEIRKNMKKIKSPYLWHRQYSDTCEEAARTCNIPLIDIRTPLENASKGIFFIDGMHPNDAGHEIIAQVLYRVLLKQNPGPS